jgi:hypothetical protein
MRRFGQLNADEQQKIIEKCLFQESVHLSELLADGQQLPEVLEDFELEFSKVQKDNETTPWFLTESIVQLVNNNEDIKAVLLAEIATHIGNAVILDKEEFVITL